MESGQNEYFSIYEQVKPVNDNINLTFTPDSLTTSYRYVIYKDDKLYKENRIIGPENAFISLSETGTYQIKVYELIEGN